MNSEVLNAVRYLCTAGMDAIAYGGTTSSFYKGPGWDEELIRMIEGESGLPAAVTTHSVAMALRSLGIRKLSIATPYPKWNNDRLWDYMEKSGFEVLSLEADNWTREGSDRMINDREPEDILEFAAQSMQAPKPTASSAPAPLGEPSRWSTGWSKRLANRQSPSNQANIWAIFGKLGLTDPIEGFGKVVVGGRGFALEVRSTH